MGELLDVGAVKQPAPAHDERDWEIPLARELCDPMDADAEQDGRLSRADDLVLHDVHDTEDLGRRAPATGGYSAGPVTPVIGVYMRKSRLGATKGYIGSSRPVV
jgi:hypothetical protein